jgi:folate-binding Fe-S cluster repair protein YgfZ
VSFTKGCFLGQELVCRIDTRGHVNRYLRRLRMGGERTPDRGAEVVADGATVGTVTSAAAVPGEPVVLALAMVRREVVPPADVVVRWPGGEVSATVEELPGRGS